MVTKAALISVEDEPPNSATLSEALKYLVVTSKGQKSAATPEILLALATYTIHLDITNLASIMAETVLELIGPIISQEPSASQTADHEAMILTLQEQQKESPEWLMPETTKLSERIQERPITQDTTPINATYASITADRSTAPLALSAAYQNDLRSRQIMVAGYNTTDTTTGERYSEEVLLKKASVAFNLMGIMAEDAPLQDKTKSPFTAAHITRAGTLSYEMISRQMAEWLRKPDVEKTFLGKYGGDADICLLSRNYPVIIYHVPVSFTPDDQYQLNTFAADNNIPPTDIRGAIWMKHPEQRKQGQAVAHLRINFASDKSANMLLRQGSLIAGRRLQTVKWIPDPKRCFKYQELNPGHIAAECKAKQNTCGTCVAKTHRTQECKQTDPANFYCSNCKRSGHGTWGRACPAMLKTRARMIDRQPEYRYVLYPVMNDASTWETDTRARHLLPTQRHTPDVRTASAKDNASRTPYTAISAYDIWRFETTSRQQRT